MAHTTPPPPPRLASTMSLWSERSNKGRGQAHNAKPLSLSTTYPTADRASLSAFDQQDRGPRPPTPLPDIRFSFRPQPSPHLRHGKWSDRACLHHPPLDHAF